MDVICVGSAGVDFCSPRLDHLPRPGEVMVVEDLPLFVGGCAANTAIGLARLGLGVGLVSRVGNDLFGQFIADYVAGYGVDVSNVRRSSCLPSARSILLPIKDQDRRLVHSFGANPEFGLPDIDLGYVARGRALFIGGFGDLPGLTHDALNVVLAHSRGAGALTFLNISRSLVASGLGLDAVGATLRHSDVLFLNEDEGRDLTGLAAAPDQAARFLEFGAGCVVVTMGERGALLRTAGEMVRTGAYAVDAVDPTGAGDAFNAGFVAATLEGRSLAERLQWASALGAHAVTRIGCHDGLPTPEELERFLVAHRLSPVA